MTSRSIVRFLPVLPLALAVACGGGKPSSSASSSGAPVVKKDGPVVATVGEDVITAADVKAKLGEQSPFLQARYRDLAHKKEFVQNLVRFEVLSQEAYRRGLDKQPDVQATIKKVLVQELIKSEFDEKKANYADADLKEYYDKHVDEFVKPERIRAAQIFIAAPVADKAARAKGKAKIAEILGQLKANDAKMADKHPQHATYQPSLFADLARKESGDVATQATGGDMRYLSHDDMAKQYTKPFADAVFALQDPNSMSGVVEDDQGFHVARLTNRQLAVNRAFDDAQVKETIKGRLFREQRTKSFDEYVEKLKKDANVTIDDKVLEAVEVPAGAPTAGMSPNGMPPLNPPPQPPPGMMPPKGPQ